MARVERAVRPGGFLFLGHAETLRGLSSEFDLRHTDDAFYYQRHDGTQETVAPWDEPAPTTSGMPPAIAETWVEVVSRTAARIERLAEPVRRRQPHRSRPPGISRPCGPACATNATAMRRPPWQRFRPRPPPIPTSCCTPPSWKPTAAGCRRRRPPARRLLDDDAFNAGAHYLLALCREAAGELAAGRAPRSGRHLSRSGLRHAASAPRPAGPAARRANVSPAGVGTAPRLLQREPRRGCCCSAAASGARAWSRSAAPRSIDWSGRA